MNLKSSTFEWICRKNESAIQKFLRIFSQWLCILFGVLAIIFMLYIPFLILTAIFAAIWIVLYRRCRIEYEFNYSSGDLTIFKILNGLRRKKKFSCTLNDINYIRKGTDEHTPTKKFYLDPKMVYTMQVTNANGQHTFLIEADEKFLQVLDQEHKLRK